MVHLITYSTLVVSIISNNSLLYESVTMATVITIIHAITLATDMVKIVISIIGKYQKIISAKY